MLCVYYNIYNVYAPEINKVENYVEKLLGNVENYRFQFFLKY